MGHFNVQQPEWLFLLIKIKFLRDIFKTLFIFLFTVMHDNNKCFPLLSIANID